MMVIISFYFLMVIIIWPTANFFGAFDYGMHILMGKVWYVCEKEAKRKARIEGSTHRCGMAHCIDFSVLISLLLSLACLSLAS